MAQSALIGLGCPDQHHLCPPHTSTRGLHLRWASGPYFLPEQGCSSASLSSTLALFHLWALLSWAWPLGAHGSIQPSWSCVWSRPPGSASNLPHCGGPGLWPGPLAGLSCHSWTHYPLLRYLGAGPPLYCLSPRRKGANMALNIKVVI